MIRFFVPGRVELVGKHVDYLAGRSITMATGRGIRVEARPHADPVLHIRAPDRGLEVILPLDPSLFRTGWETYPATVIRRVLQDIGPHTVGAAITLESDLPAASGLSSSSALITAVFLAWGHAAGWIRNPLLQRVLPDRRRLAEYLAAIESGSPFGDYPGNPGVGTQGGAQDHIAILCSRQGEVRRFAYLTERDEPAWTWPWDDLRPVVITTGVAAEKTGDRREDYNLAARRGRALAEIWNRTSRTDPGVGMLAPEERAALRSRVSGALLQRLRAFEAEDAAVDAASSALDRADAEAFAAAVNASQDAAESLLGNQIPQTVHLCRMARAHGARCASSFGAGFGGAVWALVPPGREGFADGVARDYRERFELECRVLPETPSPGVAFEDGREPV